MKIKESDIYYAVGTFGALTAYFCGSAFDLPVSREIACICVLVISLLLCYIGGSKSEK